MAAAAVTTAAAVCGQQQTSLCCLITGQHTPSLPDLTRQGLLPLLCMQRMQDSIELSPFWW